METYETESAVTLRDYLKVIFRHKAIIFTCFITVMATVVIGLKLKTPVFESSVKMLISAEKQVEATYYRELYRSQSMEVVLTQSEIVKSDPVMQMAVQATGLYNRPFDYEKRFASPLKKFLIDYQTANMDEKLAGLEEKQKKMYLFRLAVEDLKKSVRVEPIRDTNLFTITAKEFSPIGATIVANVVSRAYVIFDLEQQLAELQLKYGKKHLSVKQMSDNIEKMKESLNGEPLTNIEAIGPASVKIIEQAQVPLKPTGTPKLLTIILALVMAPFLGIMLAFMFEYMDQSFKTPQDIEAFLNIPFLSYIPKKKRLKKQALHNLSDQLYLLKKDKGIKSLLLTSALPGEGTSTITANLARYLSQKQGHKVLIIDANLRNPSMHKAFKLGNVPGLANVLEGKATLDSVISETSVIASKTSVPLDILPAGTTELNPVILLGSSKMQEIINTAKQKYELILIDGVSLKDFKDSVVLSTQSDAVALVVREGKTRKQVIKSAILPLEKNKANIIGVILNSRRFAIPDFVYNRV